MQVRGDQRMLHGAAWLVSEMCRDMHSHYFCAMDINQQ